MGRILRPKAAQLSGKKTNADEHNAFFYSLVSTDTAEMYYSTKRQQFLIQQGSVAFKVVTDLIGPQDKPQLLYSTQEKQLDLLAKVLSAGEAEAGEEVLPEDEDAIQQARKTCVWPRGEPRVPWHICPAPTAPISSSMPIEAARRRNHRSRKPLARRGPLNRNIPFYASGIECYVGSEQ